MKMHTDSVSQNGTYSKSVNSGEEFLDKVDGFSSIWRYKLNPGEFFVGAKEVAKNTDLSPHAHWAYQYILACNPNDPEDMEGFNDVVAWLESKLKIAHATASKLVRELRFHRILHKFKYQTDRGRFRWKIIFTYVPMDTADVARKFAKISGHRLISYELIKDIGNKKSDLTISLGMVANVQNLDVSDQDCKSGVVANVQNLDVKCLKNRREKSHPHKASINKEISNNNQDNNDDSASPNFSDKSSEKEQAKSSTVEECATASDDVEVWAKGYPQLEGVDQTTKKLSYLLHKERGEEPKGSGNEVVSQVQPFRVSWEWGSKYPMLHDATLLQINVSHVFYQETGIEPYGDTAKWLKGIDDLWEAARKKGSILCEGLREALQKQPKYGYDLKQPRSFVTSMGNYSPKQNTVQAGGKSIPMAGNTPTQTTRFILKPLQEGQGPAYGRPTS